MKFFLFLVLSMGAALVAQHFLPAVPPWGARIFLLPLVFLYGALSFSTPGMLVLAFLGGVMWDLVQGVWVESHGGQGSPEEVLELGVGWSVCAYAVLGAIGSGMRPLFLRGRWEVHCLFSGFATAVLTLLEYVLISLRREPLHFEFPASVWERVLGAGVTALVLSPAVFAFLGYVARWMGHRHYRPRSPREGGVHV
jgi:hypothetical protein